jgi:hypothetical protein
LSHRIDLLDHPSIYLSVIGFLEEGFKSKMLKNSYLSKLQKSAAEKEKAEKAAEKEKKRKLSK